MAAILKLEPDLVIPVGRLAIERFIPCPRMDEVIGLSSRSGLYGRDFDLIALGHLQDKIGDHPARLGDVARRNDGPVVEFALHKAPRA